jgi:hypothetical protein
VVTSGEPVIDSSAALPRRRGRALEMVRVGLGATAFMLVLGMSIEAWCGVAYLVGLYEGLGTGVLPALLAIWVIVASLTLGPAVWASWPLGKWPVFRRFRGASVLLALTATLALVVHSRETALATPSALSVADIDEPRLARELDGLREIATRLPRPRRSPPLAITSPGRCARPPEESPVTLFAAFLERRRFAPSLRCLQGDELGAVVSDLRALLLERAARGPLELELVSGWQRLGPRHAWLDGFKLRPGLDGVCFERTCALPWQLLFEGAFSRHRPLGFIPDLQFGVAPDALRDKLQAPAATGLAGLTRLVTRSYAIDLAADEPALTPLARMRRREVPVTESTLQRAARDAEAYVLSAQQPDGKFRYTLDPMTGAADTQAFNLPRQAGTTLVLCELAESEHALAAIERSLSAFEPFVRARGDLLATTADPAAPFARLGESALPLVSMLACAAERRLPLGPSVPGLARLILHLQRQSGGFAPGLDWESGVAVDGPEPLYAPGQAVMALVLLEHRQQNHPTAALPPYDELHDAVERAMQYYAVEYWSHPLRDFFFLEENWHCLAARAALPAHRHPGYEKFCLDYVRFKSRLILSAAEGAPADFDGGFGFGHLVPPHNTGAAGFAEALAAAIAIREARDEDAGREKLLLGRVLGFLLRQQWSRENCFACATRLVVGGISEHTHSAITRIDFAQHAWAAFGHGRHVLESTLPQD